jgi:hypothetical protein
LECWSNTLSRNVLNLGGGNQKIITANIAIKL